MANQWKMVCGLDKNGLDNNVYILQLSRYNQKLYGIEVF